VRVRGGRPGEEATDKAAEISQFIVGPLPGELPEVHPLECKQFSNNCSLGCTPGTSSLLMTVLP
jgi:hypothetical protein